MRKFIYPILWFALALWSQPLAGQETQTLFGDQFFSGVWGAPVFSFPFQDTATPSVRGGYGGLEFGKWLFLGYGGYGQRGFVEKADAPDIRFRTRYNGFILAMSPWARKVVHPRISLLTGPGRVFIDEGPSDKVVVLKPALGVELNAFGFFRIGVEGGYRFMLRQDLPDLSTSDSSAPFVQVDLKFGYSWGH